MQVSVIIPTFNRSKLLRRAIDSVLKQSYGNIEIIVVDDGSTDDTQEIVQGISKQTPSLIYVKKNNGGCASARNRGMELAHGELIAFLDSDDVWLPNAIESLVSVLWQSGAELVYSPSFEVDRNGREEINYPVAAGMPDMLAKAHFMATNVRPGSFIFTRDAFNKAGFHDESLLYNEDSDYFQRLAIHCKAAYSPFPTLRHFHHQSNKSNNRVEIYKALLKSSERTLAENSDFAASLGSNADRRILQIKAQLIEALALGGNFEEANCFAEDIFRFLRFSVRIALRYKMKLLLEFENICHRYLRRVIKLFVK